jgi:hypothetical protein
MNRIFTFISRYSTLITIVVMAVSILAIIIAGGAPDCFDP